MPVWSTRSPVHAAFYEAATAVKEKDAILVRSGDLRGWGLGPHAVEAFGGTPVSARGASMGTGGRAGAPKARRGRYPIAGRGASTVAVGGREVSGS